MCQMKVSFVLDEIGCSILCPVIGTVTSFRSMEMLWTLEIIAFSTYLISLSMTICGSVLLAANYMFSFFLVGE